MAKGNGKQATSEASKDELLQYYRDMLLIRRFEERAGQLYGMGLIGGFCHLYIGQEAVVVGMQSALKDGDQVRVRHRSFNVTGHSITTTLTVGDKTATFTSVTGG